MSGIFRFILSVVLVLIVVFAVLFVSFNDTPVELWLGWTFSARPFGQWLILGFVLGGFSGVLLGYGLFRRLRLKLRIHKLEAKIRRLEEENARLNNTRIRDIAQETPK